SEGSGIWLSTDNGESWTNKSNGLQGWWAYTFAPANHEDWSVGRMMVSTNNGVFYSDDYGDNWQVLDQSTTYYTGAMIHWSDPDIMWVAGATGPVQYTTDGGDNWIASAGLPFAFYPRFGLCENESGDPRVMIIYEQLGTNSYYSDDLGANYSECTGLAGTTYFTDLSVRLDDGNLGQKVYMSTDQGIFKSDNGIDYTICPQLNGMAWSVLGSQGTDVYAGASNGVFHSADEGENWEAFNTGIDYIAIWDLKYGSSTDVIYAGTRGYSVYKYGEDAPPSYGLPFSEDFTGQQQPANWQNVDNAGGDLVWQFNNPGSRDITGAGFDSDFAILDSDNYGSGAAQDADLITPPIDCSSASSVMLAFDQSFREYSGSVGTLSVSNNGTDWTVVYTVEESTGYPNPAVSVEFDISEVAAGQPQVWVKWNFVGDWAYWWAIDNVQIFEGTPVYTLPFAEDFTGQELPEDWQNIDNIGDTLYWMFNNPGGRDITGAGFDADFAILDSDEYGNGAAQDADLISPAIDCSGIENVTLSFDQSFREYSGSVGTLSVSNNGTDWTVIYTVEESTGYPDPAVTMQFDITDVAAGQPTVWIKWNYVGDWAYWWAIDNVSVTEGPLTYSLPFTEDFTGQQLPEDWQNIDNLGDTLYWMFNNPGGRDITGAGFDTDFAILDSDEYGSGTVQDADLISPPINCSGVEYVNLTFDQSFREYSESLGTVLISTNETDWTVIYTVEESSGYPNPAITVELDISQYVAGEPTVWIKWNYVGDYAYWWAIDNVSVTEGSAPTLDPPANLEASVELNTVTLTWDAPGTEALEGYNVYRDNTLLTLSPITETTYVDEFVVAGTHLYRVTAVYTEGESTPAGPVQVIIEGNVGKIHGFVRDAVTMLTLDEATVTAADVDNGAVTYMTPFGAYYSMLLPAGTFTLTCTAEGYEPATAENLLVMEGVNKSYTFYLQPLTETLTGIGEDNGTAYGFYPNPASDQLTVTGTDIREVAIFNQSGQLMMTVKDIRGKQTLNIESLPAGIYFVKMTTADSVSMDKLIIR
ncbi:MAG: T9SS type A sorting domain-containing protein, partial [Bacteroidales bacterium]